MSSLPCVAALHLMTQLLIWPVASFSACRGPGKAPGPGELPGKVTARIPPPGSKPPAISSLLGGGDTPLQGNKKVAVMLGLQPSK